MNFLQQAITAKKKELERQKKMLPLAMLKKRIAETKRKTRPFEEVLKKAKPVALIAEIKLASPFGGKLTDRDHKEFAMLYAKSKADAISVVTDTHFGGHVSFLKDVRKIARQPILRMDFIIDPYQVYETALVGADAFLLIVAALSEKKLQELLILGKKLGLGHLVETRTEREIESAIKARADTIGINNQNLKTLRISVRRTEELMQYIPSKKFVVSESGINSSEQIENLAAVGVKGFLVGTSIVTAKNPVEKIKELKQVSVI